MTEVNLSSLDEAAKEHAAVLKKAQEDFREKMSGLFTEAMSQFFKEAPRVKAIIWTQYTPYFNDGETCEFAVGYIFFLKEFDPYNRENPYKYECSDSIIEIDVSEDLYNRFVGYYQQALEREKSINDNKSACDSKYYLERVNSLRESLDNDDGTMNKCEIIRSIISSNEGLMHSLFGDHVTVYVTADQTYVDEYDHD